MNLLPFAVLALLLLPAPASGWVQSRSSKGAPIHWENPCVPVFWNEKGSMDIHDTSDTQAFLRSLEAWNDVPCSNAELIFGGVTNAEVTNYELEDPPISLVIFREKGWPYAQRPVAFTSVTYNPKTGVVVDADIELNAEDYLFTTLPSLSTSALDLQSTLTHELGHVLGFDHNNDSTSTLYPHTIAGDVTMRTLSPDDEAGLCALYPADSFPECSPVLPDYYVVDEAPREPKDSGCQFGAPPHGPPTFWMLCLALGALVIFRRISTRPRPPRSLLLPLLLLAFPLALPGPALAWEQYKAKRGAPVQWPVGTCDIPFLLHSYDIPELPGDYEIRQIQNAFDAWNAVETGALKLVTAGTTLAPRIKEDDFLNQIAFVSQSWIKSAQYAALTTITYDKYTGALLDADMEFNLVHFYYSDCEEVDPGTDTRLGPVPFAHTVLHESGHLFGLDHSAVPGSVMESTGNPYCWNNLPTELTDDDKAGKVAIYGTAEYLEAGCSVARPDTIEPVPDSAGPDIQGPDAASDTANPEAMPPPKGNGCCSFDPHHTSAGWKALLLLAVALATIRVHHARRFLSHTEQARVLR